MKKEFMIFYSWKNWKDPLQENEQIKKCYNISRVLLDTSRGTHCTPVKQVWCLLRKHHNFIFVFSSSYMLWILKQPLLMEYLTIGLKSKLYHISYLIIFLKIWNEFDFSKKKLLKQNTIPHELWVKHNS